MIRPLGGYVLVERLEEPKTIGLIHIPDTARKKALRGRVLAAGKGYVHPDTHRFIETEVKPGDIVLWEHGGEHPVPNQANQLLVSQAYLLAVIEGASEELPGAAA